MNNHQQIINATQSWLDKMVIGHNFCPFARFVRDAEQIRYRVCEGDAQAVMAWLASECYYLNDHPETATTLLILSHDDVADFGHFLDILDAANGLLQQLDLVGVYQLASFHPHYQFDGTTYEDAENYTNRSPYPVLHLIREADIERALNDYANPDKIYEDNIATTQRLGATYFAQALTALTASADSQD